MFGNARLLIDQNLPWPESDYKDPLWRSALQKALAGAFEFVILPLCVLGLVLGVRNATTQILAANFATVVIAAIVFFGEARYQSTRPVPRRAAGASKALPIDKRPLQVHIKHPLGRRRPLST